LVSILYYPRMMQQHIHRRSMGKLVVEKIYPDYATYSGTAYKATIDWDTMSQFYFNWLLHEVVEKEVRSRHTTEHGRQLSMSIQDQLRIITLHHEQQNHIPLVRPPMKFKAIPQYE